METRSKNAKSPVWARASPTTIFPPSQPPDPPEVPVLPVSDGLPELHAPSSSATAMVDAANLDRRDIPAPPCLLGIPGRRRARRRRIVGPTSRGSQPARNLAVRRRGAASASVLSVEELQHELG